MNEKEEMLYALLNLTHDAARKKFDSFAMFHAVNVLRECGIPEESIPSIDYLIPEPVKNAMIEGMVRGFKRNMGSERGKAFWKSVDDTIASCSDEQIKRINDGFMKCRFEPIEE